MKACPHCGGKSGYEYRLTIKGKQWNEWNGQGVQFSDEPGGKHGVSRCVDCGKKIDKKKGGAHE